MDESHKSIDDLHALREYALPPAGEMSLDVPGRKTGVEARRIYVGVLCLHAHMQDVPLDTALKSLWELLLTNHGFNLAAHKWDDSFLDIVDNIVPLGAPLGRSLGQSSPELVR